MKKFLLTLGIFLLMGAVAFAQPATRTCSKGYCVAPTAAGAMPVDIVSGDVVNLSDGTHALDITAAGAIPTDPVDSIITNGGAKVIDAVQLDDDPQVATQTTNTAIGGYSRVAWLISVAETDPGGTVDPQIAATVDVSHDGTNWLTGLDVVIDGTGVDSPVASVTINPGDGNTLYDFIYLPEGFTAQYARLVLTCGSNCDADEYVTVNAWIQYQQ